MSASLLRALVAGLFFWGGLVLGAQALPAGMAAPEPATLPALDFRDASLLAVFESLSQSSGINFVFDKDMPRAARVSLRLRGSTLDEALAVIMRIHQLDYKPLGERTLLIYPSSTAKQREHQDLEVRTFYLNHVDAKTAFALVRTMVKTRDLFVDERLNLLLVRDTAEAVAIAERLLAQLDQPETELVLNIELLEINRDQSSELGLNWPRQLNRGPAGAALQAPLNPTGNWFTSALNPLLLAQLRGSVGKSQLLAQQVLRARNHEKARLKVGERLPVFNSTAANGSTLSTTVAYLDVGLNLEIQPDLKIDGDIGLQLNLEINSVVAREESGGAVPAIAYRTDTRHISSTLNLSHGQTQLIAGLFNKEDRRALAGLPGLSALPLLGRLFGIQADTQTHSEVVLLLTPQILRQPSWSEAGRRALPSGLAAQADARSVRLRPSAAVSVSLNGAPVMEMDDEAGEPSQETDATGDGRALLRLSSAGVVTAGETLSITLQNASAAAVQGQLGYDTHLFQATQASQGGSDHAGLLRFELPPRGQAVFVLRALPDSAGAAELRLQSLSARARDGSSIDVRVEGNVQVEIAEP